MLCCNVVQIASWLPHSFLTAWHKSWRFCLGIASSNLPLPCLCLTFALPCLASGLFSAASTHLGIVNSGLVLASWNCFTNITDMHWKCYISVTTSKYFSITSHSLFFYLNIIMKSFKPLKKYFRSGPAFICTCGLRALAQFKLRINIGFSSYVSKDFTLEINGDLLWCKNIWTLFHVVSFHWLAYFFGDYLSYM